MVQVASHAQNAYLSNISIPRYVRANSGIEITGRCRNLSSPAIFAFSVSWRLDGGPLQTMPNIGVGAPGITTGNFMPFTHPVLLNASQGPHILEVIVNTLTDTDPSNNTITINFTALNSWADKVVLLEARTETWCPQCPPSNTETDLLMDNTGFAVAKFHMSDALNACTECITYYQQHNINYTPAGVVEMGEYGSLPITPDHFSWGPAMTARAAGVSPVELTMTSAVNQTTRVLTVTLNAEFTYAVTGPHQLNVYVLEDNVPGPQQNAPANYIHNKVMRAMLGGVGGTTGVVPNSPMVGTSYTRTYTYTVPAGFNIANLQLIGVIENSPGGFSNRYSLNCVKSSATGVGINDLSLANITLHAYPNPFVDELRIEVPGVSGVASVELFTLDGRTAFQRNLTLGQQGTGLLDMGGDHLVNGAYLLRISTTKGRAEQRLMKVDRP